MYECDWWKKYKIIDNAKQHLLECFPYKLPLREEVHLEIFISGCLFGYVHCDIEVTENPGEAFGKLLPIFRNNNVGRDDINPFMEEYAKKRGRLSRPRRMLKSSYFLENGTSITPLILFHLDLRLVCRKKCRFVQYSPLKCFSNFIQSAGNARREGDESPTFSMEETMKILANSSTGYQILDRIRHTVTKYLSDEKTHGTIDNKMFKRLGCMNDQLYET